MAINPSNLDNELLNITIKLNGSEMNGAYILHNVTVHKELNKIPVARFSVFDGDVSDGDFMVSNSSDFVPGTEVEILAGYHGGTQKSIFKGIIIKHGLEVVPQRSALLEVECRDKAVKMTVGRNNAYFVKQKDSDIIQKLIENNSGLSSSVSATSYQHPELIQYYCSDWDFMLLRAEANGLVVNVNAAKVTVGKPNVSDSAVLKLTYGDSIIGMQINMDARYQLNQVRAFSWDPSQQQIVKVSGSKPRVNTQGNITSDKLAEVLGKSNFDLISSGESAQSDIQNWANGQLVKSGLSRIQGTVTCQGNASAEPGCIVELANCGNRFNGNAYVSGVSHQIMDGTWLTELNLGLNPEWFAENTDIQAPPASGIISAMQGLHAAIVTQINQDPDGAFRVKVKLPMMQNDAEGVWARLSTFYAGNSVGAFFYPEVNDEVIVAFMNNDPRYPVIIGSVYSSKNKAPLTPDKKNPQKVIVTKEKLKLSFDDENKVIILETPGGNKITISDKDKGIILADQNNNQITMNSSGIALDSASAIKLTAKTDIQLNATGNIKLNATQDASISGLNVSNNAQIKFSAQGQAQSELKASGQVTVQGAIVMIN